ncbi:hypothetical protein Y032_0010g879 [Ancylostoma ceylanicum]|uniref:Uncharacterized protein n=1 Tax=Ancylostoma ceylanicum TaxID=53326 RepID=A0A016VI01_9BILA|nr:hypothetical protein Y032_0010g879 [Ancylostoma ceylanicum]
MIYSSGHPESMLFLCGHITIITTHHQHELMQWRERSGTASIVTGMLSCDRNQTLFPSSPTRSMVQYTPLYVIVTVTV